MGDCEAQQQARKGLQQGTGVESLPQLRTGMGSSLPKHQVALHSWQTDAAQGSRSCPSRSCLPSRLASVPQQPLRLPHHIQ